MVNRAPVYALLGSIFLLFLATGSDFGGPKYAFSQDTIVVQAEPDEAPPAPELPSIPRVLKVSSSGDSSSRDSLRLEIQEYSRAIAGLRDSLNFENFDIEMTEEQRLRLERTIDDFTRIIEGIGGELSQMELEIVNNRISLLDPQGEGIIIDIPENLDEQLTQGFELLQKIILSELPESQSEDIERSWSWGFGGEKPQKPQRKILKGNIVKVWDNLLIADNEDVRGNVVVVFGDGEISGRVDGDVVTVFGNLMLTETAEVTGQIVTVGGRLDQDNLAEVGDVVVVDPFPGWDSGGSILASENGLLGFLVGIGELVLVILLTLLVLAIAPRVQLDRVLDRLNDRPLSSLWVGMGGTFVLYLLGLILIAILVLTVIGIPVALLVLVVLMLLSVLSVGVVAITLGRRICTMFAGSCKSDWQVLVLGILVLDGVYLIGVFAGLVPSLGMVADGLVIIGAGIKLVAYLFGMGAMLLSRFGRA